MGINSKLKLIESQSFCIIVGIKGINLPGVRKWLSISEKGLMNL